MKKDTSAAIMFNKIYDLLRVNMSPSRTLATIIEASAIRCNQEEKLPTKIRDLIRTLIMVCSMYDALGLDVKNIQKKQD